MLVPNIKSKVVAPAEAPAETPISLLTGVISSLTDYYMKEFNITKANATLFAGVVADKTQAFLRDFSDSSNFDELSSNLASQIEHDIAQLGITIEIQRRAVIKHTAISIIMVFRQIMLAGIAII